MKVLVSLEHRFSRTPDGAVWTQTQFPNPFWQRYLDVFSKVCIVARAQPVDEVPNDYRRVDGKDVEFFAVPYYHGFAQYLRRRKEVQASICRVVNDCDAAILRVHSPIGIWIQRQLKKQGRPYGVEVVADAWELFSRGATKHRLRPLFQRYFDWKLRQQCREAIATSYVTQFALQRRYPPHPQRFTTDYSDVELPPGAWREAPREFREGEGLRLLTVGALDQMYKGVDLLVEAVARCTERGCQLHLTVVGDGQHLPSLRRMAEQRGIGDRVEFLGSLAAGAAVRERLDHADLFVLASRQEGLPRALIEAMARALPCIGTTVGGIPELLDPDDLVPPNDPESLAQSMMAVAGDATRLNSMSKRNLQRTACYEDSELRRRRNEFFRAVHAATWQWKTRNRQLLQSESLNAPQQPTVMSK